MSKHVFTVHEKWAIFKVHGERCYLGREPIDLRTMQVDHIVPESLLDEPGKLAKVLVELGLPKDFNLNTYENWMPACGPCNNRKRAQVFEAVPIVLAELDKAKKGADECRKIEASAIRDRDVANALTHLERAAERDELKLDQLAPLITAYAKSSPDALEELVNRAKDGVIANLGFQRVKELPEFRIAPDLKVLFADGNIRIVKTPVGVGYVPASENPHHSFYCGHCGSLGPWSGARCLSCGMMDDGD